MSEPPAESQLESDAKSDASDGEAGVCAVCAALALIRDRYWSAHVAWPKSMMCARRTPGFGGGNRYAPGRGGRGRRGVPAGGGARPAGQLPHERLFFF